MLTCIKTTEGRKLTKKETVLSQRRYYKNIFFESKLRYETLNDNNGMYPFDEIIVFECKTV